MANDFDGAALRRRLDAMILLLLEASPSASTSMAHKIQRLLELGFTQSEVAQIIGKKLNYVTAVIATRKRSGAKSKDE